MGLKIDHLSRSECDRCLPFGSASLKVKSRTWFAVLRYSVLGLVLDVSYYFSFLQWMFRPGLFHPGSFRPTREN